jgi:hypothetical protein
MRQHGIAFVRPALSSVGTHAVKALEEVLVQLDRVHPQIAARAAGFPRALAALGLAYFPAGASVCDACLDNQPGRCTETGAELTAWGRAIGVVAANGQWVDPTPTEINSMLIR